MTDEATPTKADRRRAARGSSETPNDALLQGTFEEQTQPEPGDEADAQPTDGEKSETGVAITQVIANYGAAIQDLQRVNKIPPQVGIRLVELVLQYDINRRNLALQEAEIMTRFQGGTPFGVPEGAVPRTPEEADALQAGERPDLDPAPEE